MATSSRFSAAALSRKHHAEPIHLRRLKALCTPEWFHAPSPLSLAAAAHAGVCARRKHTTVARHGLASRRHCHKTSECGALLRQFHSSAHLACSPVNDRAADTNDDAAAMSLSLKHIPCPAGPNCSAYMCLFGGHATDEKSSGPPADETQDRNEAGTKPAAAKETTESAKDVTMESPTPTSGQLLPSVASQPTSAPAGDIRASPSPLQSLRRPISPPKQRQNPKPAAPAAAKPKPPPPAPKPEKQESLNPRLLKHSPASHEVRLKLLRMMHAELKRLNDGLYRAKPEDRRLVLSEQQLITRVLDEEEDVAVSRASVYTNVMKNNIMKVKRLKVDEWRAERQKEVPPAGKKRQHGEMEESPVVVETGLTPSQEVQLLQRILTPIDNLGGHGYVSAVPSPEAIAAAREGLDAAKGWEKCDRCEQRFQVFAGRRAEDGALASGGACNFHWGKAYFPQAEDRSKQPKRYLCCNQQIGDSAGCITHPNHVFKASDPKRLAAVFNYEATPENPTAPTDRAVCFDCEMGYTVYGMELIRLTATSWPDGEEILDVLVKPLGEVLDLNSRYSGVWPDDLARAEPWEPGDPLVPAKISDDAANADRMSVSEDGQLPKRKLKAVSSPAAARALLFSLLSPSTPLIGHGLENDLNAVRVVHPTLVDTILAFPHKNGLPYRLSLRGLMSTHLNRKIQVQTGPKMTGHDSAEDARAAGELVRFRVAKEWADMKRDGWKVVDGQFVSPVANGSDKKDGALTEEFIEAAAE